MPRAFKKAGSAPSRAHRSSQKASSPTRKLERRPVVRGPQVVLPLSADVSVALAVVSPVVEAACNFRLALLGRSHRKRATAQRRLVAACDELIDSMRTVKGARG